MAGRMEKVKLRHKAAVGLLVITVALAVIVVYMMVASLHGPHGLVRHIQIEKLETEANRELALLRDERSELENYTRRLGTGSIDLDLLEAQARQVLGVARVNELLLR